MHFSEIIKLQLIKNAICCFVFQHFLELLFLNYLLKMHGYPQFSLWIPTALAKICYSHIVISCAKNLSCISRHCPKTINFELSIFNQVSALCLFLCGKRSVLLQTSKHSLVKIFGGSSKIFKDPPRSAKICKDLLKILEDKDLLKILTDPRGFLEDPIKIS